MTVWVVESKDGAPEFCSTERAVCLDYLALVRREKRRDCKPQPVPYERTGQQEMFDGVHRL